MKPTETSLTDNLGAQFGPYKLVRRLGVGGMAETFVAVRTGPGGFTQRVCLKLVLPFFRDNPEFIELFQREARLAAKLRHRNIVGIIDFGEFEETSYMALELIDGLDLRRIIDSQPDSRLSAGYVALLGLELAEALEHAHHPPAAAGIESTESQIPGIVHRDISPSNVLVSRQGEILLTDFGVAKAMSKASRKQSAVKGKVPYMSPEQLRAEPLDGRADLFALGVVLFEALAGERPYEGAHDPATIMLILKGEHGPLVSLAPDAPPGLCNVIESLITPDPADRPATAGALIEALDAYAPSPRVRRELGRLVTELAIQHEQQKGRRTSSHGSNRTEILPEEDTGGVSPSPWGPPAEPRSGVEPSGAMPPPSSSPPAPGTPMSAPPFGPSPTDSPLPSPPSPAERPSSTPDQPAQTAPPSASPASFFPGGDQPQPSTAGKFTPPAQAAGDPVKLVRPPSDASASFRHVREPELDTTLTTLREQRHERGPGSGSVRPRRRFWLPLLGAVLSVGVVASAAVLLWPSDEDPNPPGKQEPARQVPDAEELPTRTPSQKPETVKKEGLFEAAPAEDRPEESREDERTKPAVDEPARGPAPGQQEASEKPSSSAEKAPSTPQPQGKEPGRLTITVFPWGNIWINGEPWGPAPLKGEPMRPGTYKISVGQRAPSKTEVVRLRAGRRKSVHFNLDE